MPSDWLREVAELAILGSVLAILTAVAAIYVMRRVRSEETKSEPHASQLMAKFRQMHSEGVLSDEEFRTIKTTLTARFQEELKDSGQTG